MKPFLLFIFSLCLLTTAFSQQSDFIILKKRNNRTLKTYYPGSFISAVTVNGFHINGFITAIRNDSIYWRQEQLQLVPTEFGSTIDTIKYSLGIPYTVIVKYNYTSAYTWGRKKGFVQVVIPKLMMIGGVGFIVLELVNTAYRKESLTADNKMLSLGIAAGVAFAGYAIENIKLGRNKVGGKYNAIYVKAGTIQ